MWAARVEVTVQRFLLLPWLITRYRYVTGACVCLSVSAVLCEKSVHIRAINRKKRAKRWCLVWMVIIQSRSVLGCVSVWEPRISDLIIVAFIPLLSIYFSLWGRPVAFMAITHSTKLSNIRYMESRKFCPWVNFSSSRFGRMKRSYLSARLSYYGRTVHQAKFSSHSGYISSRRTHLKEDARNMARWVILSFSSLLAGCEAAS